MTPQLEKWLRFAVNVGAQVGRVENRRATSQALLPHYWRVTLVWNGFGARDMKAEGFGASPDAAELAALEEYAKRIFVPGALEQGRRSMGLAAIRKRLSRRFPKRRRKAS